MKLKMIVAGSLATLALSAAAVQADSQRLPVERLDEVLQQASAFGVQHYQSIKVKGDDSVEVGGWFDEQWRARVGLSLAAGDSRVDELTRRKGGARGMASGDMRLAMDAAVAEGLAEFEEVQVDRDGRIEIEGRDADGLELEIHARRDEGGMLQAARD
ncbi:PepSY domain-containing protein [Billgrantia diversa]|uniref:PepSY domain-containing protein n=1 Tax=Halomonas sp. MCCC 1A13316 TaxID=2733487 RepID=UPI0018A4EF6B|nr:PepSY domain-containing protein [Halomonas sp. MCCC 1A13316]QOR38051.1 PepSY domain-containing protein [Halomonas sp. MCCC 1A13316]